MVIIIAILYFIAKSFNNCIVLTALKLSNPDVGSSKKRIPFFFKKKNIFFYLVY